MVMTCQPIYDCYLNVLGEIPKENKKRVIYMSPKGRMFSHNVAKELSEYDNLIFLCGHYEGVDQRIIDEIVDEEISIGDYVLTGGEMAAAIISDAIVRLIPGAIGDEQSALSDSFQDNLLAPPVYTRPAEYRGMKVPEILLSGNERKIAEWEHEVALERTERLRPDLL
jgi:tRNA (guanine37-N1)-methyltransferase